MAEFDASRGTVLWGFNHFRSEGLGNILNDLLDREKKGLDETNCRRVKIALGKIVNVATDIPGDSWLRGPIWRELEVFERLYHRWNDEHTGPEASEHRARILKIMRKRRYRIAKRIRNNQYILSNELDMRLINNLYDALRELATSSPDLFKHLSVAVKRFDKSLSR